MAAVSASLKLSLYASAYNLEISLLYKGYLAYEKSGLLNWVGVR